MSAHLKNLLQEMTEFTLTYWAQHDLAKYDQEKVGHQVFVQFCKAPGLIRYAVYGLLLPLGSRELFRIYLTGATTWNPLIKILAPIFSYVTCLIALSSEDS